MKGRAWRAFAAARDKYRAFTEALGRELPELQAAQQALVNRRRGPSYTVETSVVYNHALDDVHAGDDIRLILVADNPGRREQAAENRRYLVGPSGKIAEKFFRDNPILGIDFRRNVIILNKTPIHTPRTAELRELGHLSGPEPAGEGAGAIAGAIIESQRVMARLIREFHRALSLDMTPPSGDRSTPVCSPPEGTLIPVWIIGYSEMKNGGVFEVFTRTLRELYAPVADGPENQPGNWLFLFRHFSMNQFTIDLRQKAATGETAPDTLSRIGAAYRERFLGW
ncbi:MAG: hypothetical protein LBD78_03170 [Spirochaetaceae bacterium]|jgi:hypothetical protein|nr:hypothetical protein [Spirochaetaceae bacterium]